MKKRGNGLIKKLAAHKNENNQKNQTSGLTSFFSKLSPVVVAVAFVLPTVFLFTVTVNQTTAASYTFSQNNWSSTSANNTTGTTTNWSQYLSKDADLDTTSPTSLKLLSTSSVDQDSTFTNGINSQTDVVGSEGSLSAQVQVSTPNRVQNLSGAMSPTTSLVVDPKYKNIHAFFYNTNSLYYRQSQNGGASWAAAIALPKSFTFNGARTATKYGSHFEAAADNNNIYVVYNAYNEGSGSRFGAVIISKCNYAGKNAAGQNINCSESSSWSTPVVVGTAIDHEGDGAFNGTTFTEKGKYISLKIANGSLHTSFTWSTDAAYAVCQISNNCTGSNSTWSLADLNVPNNPLSGLDMTVSSTGRVAILYQVANNGNSVLNYAFCLSSCFTYTNWRPTNLSPSSTTLGTIDSSSTSYKSLDTIIDKDGKVVVAYYSGGNSVMYLRSSIALSNATSTTVLFEQLGSCQVANCHRISSGSYEVENSVKIALDSNNDLRIFFKYASTNNGSVYSASLNPIGSWGNNTLCSSSTIWYCTWELFNTGGADAPGGGIGISVAYKDGSPLILTSNGTTVHFLIKQFYNTGNYFSKVYGSGTSTKWQSLKIYFFSQDGVSAMPSGTSITTYVRSKDTIFSATSDTNAGWCQVPSPATFSITTTLDLNTLTGCVHFSPSAKYFEYYLRFTTDTVHTPIISQIDVSFQVSATISTLTSSPIQLSAQVSDLPTISSVSWKETMTTGTSAKTSLQIRTSQNNTFTTDPNWYGAGTAVNGKFTSLADPNGTTAGAKDATCTRTPLIGSTVRQVVCQIDTNNPIYKNGYTFAQYKIILESPLQDGGPIISEVQINYTINSQPTVSNVTISQNSLGVATINYNVSDDGGNLNIGLFYDLGVTLDTDPGAVGTQIIVTPPSGIDLTALIPATGIILIDDEQIKYQYRGATYLGSSGLPVTRGFGSTIASSHPIGGGKKVWFRAVDASIASTLSATSYASGAIGSSQTPGSGKTINWSPAKDIVGKIYMTGLNIRVLASDGQPVKPVGSATITSNFTLDTKAPQIGSSALSFSTNVVDNNGKPKAKNTSIGLTIAAPNTTNDNTTGNKMSFCVGVCGVPDATELLAVGGNWSDLEVLGGTKNLTIGNGQTSPQTVSVAVMDNVGNISLSKKDLVYDVTAPQKPNNFTVEDASNQTIGALVYLRWQAIALPTDGWGASDFDKFSIYRKEASDCSSAAGTFSEITSVSTPSATSYVDSSAQPNVNYIYKIVATDNIANSSSDLTTAPSGCVKPQPSGEPAPPPPVITNITQAAATTNSIVVTWKTTEPSDSRIAYAPRTRPVGGDFTGYQTQGHSGIVTDHSVTLVGLEAGTLYYFEVRSLPPGSTTAGARSVYNSSDVGFTSDLPMTFTTATPPPVIKPVITLNSPPVTFTHDTATFKWSTDIDADSFIEYGTSASLGSYFGQKESTKIHSVTITSLTPSTVYYYRIHSTAGEGESISPLISQSPASFTTTQDPKDTTPPTYQNIQVSNIQFNTATITWTTNEPATQFVEFWKDGDTSDLHRLYPITKGELLTAHSVQLPLDLQAETVYHYQVISFDASNNGIPSPQQPSFTTKADPGNVPDPIISNLRNDPATATTVTIYFSTTNIPSSAIIEYSVDDQSYNQAQSFPIITNDHALTLLNLTPAKLYFFRARAINTVGQSVTQNICGGQNCSFTTLASDNPLPTIVDGSIQVTNISPNNATITWQTTQPGNSLVEFGTAVSDSGEPLYGRTFGNVKDNTTSHTIILPDDLIPEQTYHFRVRTRDAFNQLMVYPAAPDPTDPACLTNAANCQDPTFTTTVSQQILVAESKTPPIITGVAPLLVTDTKAVIGWTTDKPADSEVNFGISTSYGSTLSDKLPPAGTNANAMTRSHAMTIDGLQPKTKYYFTVISTDISDQRQEDDNGGAGYSFETTAGTGLGESEKEGLTDDLVENDTTAPVITEVTVSDITSDGATLSWSTDESATSLAEYGKTTDYGSLTGDVSQLTSQHTVKIEGLLSGTEYHVRPVSYDGFGNGARGNDLTFTTTGEKEEDEEEDEDKDGEDKKGEDELDEATKKIKELSADKKLSLEKIIELLQEYAEEDVAKILSSIGIQLVSPPKFTGGAPRVEVTTTSATITWQTDKESDSRVAWVKGDDYRASKDDPYTSETGDTQSFTSNHEVNILNLEPGTVYHYQLRSREAAGRTARSIDRTFKTLPLKPEIQGLRISGVTENTATLVWKTNVATKSIINYIDSTGKQKRSQGDPQFVTNHTFTINDLAGNTAYTVILIGEDENGLKVESKPLSLRTIKDNSAPVISQVRTEVSLTSGKQDVAQAIITWKTNESSTSQILYEEGVTPGADPKLASDKGSEYLQNHVIVINRLRPATVYRFRVVSEDRAGNKAVSNDFTLLTPQKKESVLEIIVKNFEETFGFLKLFGR